MAFDFGPGTDDNRHATRTLAGRAPRHTRLSVTVSTWMVAALAGAVGVASCSSLDSGSKSGAGGSAAGGKTGSGGIVGGMGGSGTGGSGAGGSAAGGSAAGGTGAGGAGVDAAVDAPATDVPVPCGPDNDCCPSDPNKTDPGACGCGVADTDTDGDGVADCLDACPSDPGKYAVGICGCGVPDVNTGDTDGDGTPDCIDECPKDKTRIKRGVCGCGTADSAAPLCLAHRYQFNDLPGTDGGATDGGSDGGVPSGTIIHDSAGNADGVAVRCAPSGNGSITLTGSTPTATQDQYIQLPGGIISSLGNSATFEAWINWTGGAAWQRIFDFGGNDQPVGNKGTGNSFIFVTPLGGPAGVLFNSFITLGQPVTEAAATTALAAGAIKQVAVVVNATPGDGGAPSMTLYLDGALVMSSPITGAKLNDVNDVNNWLGRSQFALDPSLAGTYYDFRIFSTALTADQIHANFLMGMDALP